MRWYTLALLSLALSLATPAWAQQADPAQPADPRAMLQQIRGNMQNAGVTPQDIAQNLRQQRQNGTLTPQSIQQQLIDNGIVSQDMISQFQNQMQNRNPQVRMNTLQAQLGASNDEWAILSPKIQRILDLTAELAKGTVTNNGRGVGMVTVAAQPQGQGAAPTPSVLATTLAELNALLADENAPPSDIKLKLTVLREARDRVKSDLTAARSDLLSFLTLRQEGILLTLAVLE